MEILKPKPPSDEYELLKLTSNGMDISEEHLLTLVTQVSMDRLNVLERSLQTWTGPVSIAIYVPVKDGVLGIQDWQR